MVKLVQQPRVQYLTYCLLRACPAVLNVLKLRYYFAHLIPVNTYVFIKEFLYAVRTEIQKYRQLLKLFIVCRLIDVNDIGEDFRESGKNVGVQSPLDLGQEIAEDSEFIHVDEHFFTDSS